MERKRVLRLFEEQRSAWGSFDDFPGLAPGADPMPHLSRNTVSQPFFLAIDQDETLINPAGEGEICFEGERRERISLVAGDSVYLPAGLPSRILTHTPSLQIRFRAETPVRQAVAWYCEGCHGVVYRVSIEESASPPQEAYWDAVHAFNRDDALRRGASCGTAHPPAEFGDIAWPEVAKAIRSSTA